MPVAWDKCDESATKLVILAIVMYWVNQEFWIPEEELCNPCMRLCVHEMYNVMHCV